MGCRVPLGVLELQAAVDDQGGAGDAEAVLGWACIEEQQRTGRAQEHSVGPAESARWGGGSLLGDSLPAPLSTSSENVKAEVSGGCRGGPAPTLV